MRKNACLITILVTAMSYIASAEEPVIFPDPQLKACALAGLKI
ncbi:MAG: hypothetical protein WAV28_14800 [Sedimentisphaerales bacterium]